VDKEAVAPIESNTSKTEGLLDGVMGRGALDPIHGFDRALTGQRHQLGQRLSVLGVKLSRRTKNLALSASNADQLP
jgi:hypothetical protein